MHLEATNPEIHKTVDMYYLTESLVNFALEKEDYDLAIKIADVSYDTFSFGQYDLIPEFCRTDAIEKISQTLIEKGEYTYVEKLLDSKGFNELRKTDNNDKYTDGGYSREKIAKKYSELIKNQIEDTIQEKLQNTQDLDSEKLKNEIITTINTKIPDIQSSFFKKNFLKKELFSYAAGKFAEKELFKESGELMQQSQKENAQDREKRVEAFHQMRENILQGNLVSLGVIESKINTNIIESLNFTHEELQKIAVNILPEMDEYKGLEYLKKIGYDMNIENIGELLTKIIIERDLPIYKITEIVRGVDRPVFIENNTKYFLRFPISKEAARHLLNKGGGSTVYDKRTKDESEEQPYLTWANGTDNLILTDALSI